MVCGKFSFSCIEFKGIAVPATLSALFTYLTTVVDTFFVSTIGDAAIAGIGLFTSVLMFLVMGMHAIGSGLSPTMLKAVGRDDRREVAELFSFGAYLALGVAFVVFVVFSLLKPQIVNVFQAPEDVLQSMSQYYSVWLLMVFSIALRVAEGPILKGYGYAKVVMYAGLGLNLLNLVFDYLFVIVFQWGVEGAAWASVLSSYVSEGVTLFLLYRLLSVRLVAVSKEVFKRFYSQTRVYLGSGFVASLYIPAGMFFLNFVVSNFSTEAIAAYALFSKTDLFWFALTGGVGDAMRIMMGKAGGKGRWMRVNNVFVLANRLMFSTAVLLVFLFWLFGGFVGSVFLNSPESVSIFADWWWVYALPYAFWWVIANVNALFTHTNRPKKGLACSSSRVALGQFVFPGVGALMFGFGGFIGGMAAGYLFAALVVLVLWKRGRVFKEIVFTRIL